MRVSQVSGIKLYTWRQKFHTQFNDFISSISFQITHKMIILNLEHD